METFREELRAALDASMLTHTGRSIGDLASQRVIDEIWPLIEAREAALVEVVAQVVESNDDHGDGARCHFCGFTPYLSGGHANDCKREQARTLVSED